MAAATVALAHDLTLLAFVWSRFDAIIGRMGAGLAVRGERVLICGLGNQGVIDV